MGYFIDLNKIYFQQKKVYLINILQFKILMFDEIYELNKF